MKKGILFMSIGIIFFILGLDEHSDYLRAFHGLWHLFASLSSN